MKDAGIRALRTFIQSLIGAFLATSVLTAIASSSTIDVDALKRAVISAVAAGVIASLSFIQNWLEDASGKTIMPK